MSASVSPEVIRELDSRVRLDLQQIDDRFFWWVAASATVVAIGCMMEGPEILHEIWPKAFPLFSSRWVKYVGLIGWFLVVLGVAGEGVIEIYDHHASDLLQTFDEVLLTDTQRQTAGANERAASAFDRAAKTESEASQENERAARTEQQASEENARAAEALKAAEVARKNAEGFSAQIAQANERAAAANETAERERLARLQLEARLADRVITPDQQRRIAEAFAPMKGQTVDVLLVGDSLEETKTANAILGAISNAGVLLNFFHPMAGANAEGVIVGVRADAPDVVRQAGNRLIAILMETLGGGVGQDDFEKIQVNGTGTSGSSKGAAPNGQSPFRLVIAPK